MRKVLDTYLCAFIHVRRTRCLNHLSQLLLCVPNMYYFNFENKNVIFCFDEDAVSDITAETVKILIMWFRSTQHLVIK